MNSLKDVLFFLESKNIEDLDVLDLDSAEQQNNDTEDFTDTIETHSGEQEDTTSHLVLTYLGSLNNEEDFNVAYQQLADILCGNIKEIPASWESTANTNQFDIHPGIRYADYVDELKGLSNSDINQLLHHGKFSTEVPGVFSFETEEIDFNAIKTIEKSGSLEHIDAINSHLETDPIANHIAGKEASAIDLETSSADEEQVEVYIAELQKLVDESTDETLKARLQEIILNLQKTLASN